MRRTAAKAIVKRIVVSTEPPRQFTVELQSTGQFDMDELVKIVDATKAGNGIVEVTFRLIDQ